MLIILCIFSKNEVILKDIKMLMAVLHGTIIYVISTRKG